MLALYRRSLIREQRRTGVWAHILALVFALVGLIGAIEDLASGDIALASILPWVAWPAVVALGAYFVRHDPAHGTAWVVGCALAAGLIVGIGAYLGINADRSGPTFDAGPDLEGGRIERLASGYAITFPDDWYVQEADPETEIVQAMSKRYVDGQHLDLLAEERGGDSRCGLVVSESTPASEPMLLGAYARSLEQALDDDSKTNQGASIVVVPAGLITQHRWSEDGSASSAWALRGSDNLIWITCWADERPDDEWLPIVESIECIGNTSHIGPVSPMLPDAPVEHEGGRFSVSFPDGWIVERVDETTSRFLLGLDADEVAATRLLLFATDIRSAAECQVADFAASANQPPARSNVWEATLDYQHQIGASGAIDVEANLPSLAAGLTGHVRYTESDGWPSDAYYYRDGGRWHSLECWSPQSRAHHLDIAESFEYLPLDR